MYLEASISHSFKGAGRIRPGWRPPSRWETPPWMEAAPLDGDPPATDI